MSTAAAWTADCVTISVRAPSHVVIDIAMATTRTICHTPVPKKCTNTSPTNTPMVTPTATSTTRPSRWPNEKPRQMMAATVARNGSSWPSRRRAIHHETPAASAICRIMNSRERHRPTRLCCDRHPRRAVRSDTSNARIDARCNARPVSCHENPCPCSSAMAPILPSTTAAPRADPHGAVVASAVD